MSNRFIQTVSKMCAVKLSKDEIEFLIYEPLPEVEKKLKELSSHFENKKDLLKLLLKHSREHPALFVKTILKHPLFDYQIEFLESIPKHRRIVINAGRQVGKSTVTALALLWFLIIENKQERFLEGRKIVEPALYLSLAPSYQQAQILFHKIQNILFERRAFYRLFIEKIKRSSSREEIITRFASKYMCRSIKGKEGSDILRGFTAKGIIIDEAAFIPDLDVIMNEVLEPMTSTTNGWIIMISSPNTSEDFFYRAFKGLEGDWLAFHWTSNMNPLAREFFEKKKIELGSDSPIFKKEYLAIPPDSTNAVFDIAKLKKALRNPLLKLDDYDAFSFGLDFGVSYDRSVLVVIGWKREPELFEIVDFHVFKEGEEWNKVVDYAIERFDNMRSQFPEKIFGGYFDATVFGEQIGNMYPELLFRLEPFKITSQRRIELISLLRSIIEVEKLTVPYFAHQFYLEASKMYYKKLPSGNIKPEHPPKGHDDTVIATALAVKYVFDRLK